MYISFKGVRTIESVSRVLDKTSSIIQNRTYRTRHKYIHLTKSTNYKIQLNCKLVIGVTSNIRQVFIGGS